jgi:hypothetical protein
VKIDPETYQRLTTSILDVVQHSVEPVAVAAALEALMRDNDEISQDLVVALIWQLLATEQLKFDPSRKLLVGPIRHLQYA